MPEVIGSILMHLGLRLPWPFERIPATGPEAWLAGTSLTLTYHRVPDIA